MAASVSIAFMLNKISEGKWIEFYLIIYLLWFKSQHTLS